MSRLEVWGIRNGVETRRSRTSRDVAGTPQSPPFAPSTFTVTVTGTTTATATWTAATVPTGSPAVGGYRIYTGTTLRATTGAGATTANITGLTPGTTYSFNVNAYNTVGESPDSIVRTVTTTSDTNTGTRISFVGEPAAGQYYLGWADGPTYVNQTWGGNGSLGAARHWTPNPPDISVYHNYSTATVVSMTMIQEAIDNNLIPSQSFKMDAFPPASILAGDADSAITASANACAALKPWPIWLCYYHEPEDNITTDTAKADYRAATRRIVTRFRAAGATNVAFMPIYMCPYTFIASYGANRDWRTWHADWTGTGWQDDLMMDMIGLDIYNPLPTKTGVATGTSHTFSSMLDGSRAVMEQPGYPLWKYVAPEFGMSFRASPYPDWNAWCIEARDCAKQHFMKSFNYWDNSADLNRYSFTSTGDPDGTKLQGWKTLAASATKWVSP